MVDVWNIGVGKAIGKDPLVPLIKDGNTLESEAARLHSVSNVSVAT